MLLFVSECIHLRYNLRYKIMMTSSAVCCCTNLLSCFLVADMILHCLGEVIKQKHIMQCRMHGSLAVYGAICNKLLWVCAQSSYAILWLLFSFF